MKIGPMSSFTLTALVLWGLYLYRFHVKLS